MILKHILPMMNFPLAYGYNTVLLSSSSAAILDIPIDSYILGLQDKLAAGEGYEIRAYVKAYLATVDESNDFRTKNATWKGDLAPLQTVYLYEGKGARMGMMPVGAEHVFRPLLQLILLGRNGRNRQSLG